MIDEVQKNECIEKVVDTIDEVQKNECIKKVVDELWTLDKCPNSEITQKDIVIRRFYAGCLERKGLAENFKQHISKVYICV